jgi:hypothetical protein
MEYRVGIAGIWGGKQELEPRETMEEEEAEAEGRRCLCSSFPQCCLRLPFCGARQPPARLHPAWPMYRPGPWP